VTARAATAPAIVDATFRTDAMTDPLSLLHHQIIGSPEESCRHKDENRSSSQLNATLPCVGESDRLRFEFQRIASKSANKARRTRPQSTAWDSTKQRIQLSNTRKHSLRVTIVSGRALINGNFKSGSIYVAANRGNDGVYYVDLPPDKDNSRKGRCSFIFISTCSRRRRRRFVAF
jgi:hypothetical protein